MGVTLYVDLDALQTLANNLSAIYNALDQAGDTFDYGESDSGSSDVSGALDDFCDGWKDGRKTIKDEINSLMQAVQGAAEDYLRNERAITQSSTSAGVNTSTNGPH